jgi:hypothetical protein
VNVVQFQAKSVMLDTKVVFVIFQETYFLWTFLKAAQISNLNQHAHHVNKILYSFLIVLAAHSQDKSVLTQKDLDTVMPQEWLTYSIFLWLAHK